MTNPLGLTVPTDRSTRSLIGEVTTSPSGNVVLRIGHTYEDSSAWEQTEYVVLNRDEAQALIERLQAALTVYARYLVVSGHNVDSMGAYLYSSDSITAVATHPTLDSERFVAVVQVTGSDDKNAAYRAEYVQGRLQSGLYGATIHDTQDEANAESVVRRALLGI